MTGGVEPHVSLRVLGISWERIHLIIHVRVVTREGGGPDVPIDFEVFTGSSAYPASSTSLGDGRYDLTFNITTFANRQAIPNGTWRIRAVVDGEPDGIALLDASRITALDDASRVFLYNSNRSVYTVSFGVADNDVDLEFLMRVYQLNQTPARRTWRSVPRRMRNSIIGPTAKQRYARWIYAFYRRWPGIRQGQLLFASEQRQSLEGNLKRVHDRLIEHGLDSKFAMRYSFRVPGSSEWKSTIRVLRLLATSEIVLLDDYFAMLNNITIDDRTTVIQLWHAGSGFKAVGFSRFGNSGSPMLKNAHRSYTYAITGSEHLVPVYAEAFGIEPESVIPTGLPRVDWFLDDERTAAFTEEFYTQFPALRGKRIILFAPTFRGRSINSAFYDYSLIDFDALYELCGDDAVVLFRMHHFITDPMQIPAQYADRFFDFTHYANGLELLHVTDLLITDYSSIIYEYSLLDRPMLFFAPDKANYAATRGFHRDFDETAQAFADLAGGAVVDHQRRSQHQERQGRRARGVDLADAGVDQLDAVGHARLAEFVIDRGENEDLAAHAK